MKKTKLVIVESPHKAHLIQEFLGPSYVVMASKGHIADLAKGGSNGIGIDIEKNFRPRYALLPDKIQTMNEILNAAKNSELVILSGDPDREGESICWHIASRLEGIQAPIKRMVFNEIKKDKILKAVKDLKDIDMNMVHAQEGRRFLDRIVGFMVSPYLINTMNANLSAGRVQSVVTKLVIDREKEIESFVPQTFWTAQVSLSNDGKKSFIAKYPSNMISQKDADDVKTKLSSNTKYIVKNVTSAEENKGPPAPLVTSSLQQIMSKAFSFGSEKTMKAAQSLYENGKITYLRTDSVRASDESIEEVRQWLSTNSHKTPKKPNNYKNKDDAQDAHECLRPTDINLLPSNLKAGPDEKIVYETIWKYFVASQMNPATYSTLKITLNVDGDPKTEVTVSGKALKTKGYLEILGGAEESKIDLPMLVKGDVVNVFGKSPILIEKKKTQPPARYSEDKLLKELVNKNIGRPATYAELLTKVCNRNYVEKKGNVYHATDLGKKVTDTLSSYFNFMDYNYTSDLEVKLDQIAEGKLNHIEMLKEFYSKFKKELDNAYEKNGTILCEKCKSPMILRTTKSNGNKFLGCQSYPNCKNIKPL